MARRGRRLGRASSTTGRGRVLRLPGRTARHCALRDHPQYAAGGRKSSTTVFTKQGRHYAGRVLIPEELTALRAAAWDCRLARVMIAFWLFALVNFAVWVAVLLYAYAQGGAGLAGLVGVAQLLPAAALAPMFGSVGDRMPRGTALCGAYASEAVSVGAVCVLLLV